MTFHDFVGNPKNYSDEWETPSLFYNWRNSIWNFDVDVAASHTNTKCSTYFTKDDNALVTSWNVGSRAWCNCPFSLMEEFLNKAHYEVMVAKNLELVEVLGPANTDTKWFNIYSKLSSKTTLLTGRVPFEIDGKPPLIWNEKKQKWVRSGNPKGSVLFLFVDIYLGRDKIEVLDWKEECERLGIQGTQI